MSAYISVGDKTRGSFFSFPSPSSFSLHRALRSFRSTLPQYPIPLNTTRYPPRPLPMAPTKFVHLFALVAVALVALSVGPVSVNALVADRSHVARHVRGHEIAAKRRRDTSSSHNKRCKPNPATSSLPPTSTPAVYSPVPSTPAPSTSVPAATSSTPAPSSTPSTGGGSSSGKKWGLAWPNGDSDYLSNFASLPNVG